LKLNNAASLQTNISVNFGHHYDIYFNKEKVNLKVKQFTDRTKMCLGLSIFIAKQCA